MRSRYHLGWIGYFRKEANRRHRAAKRARQHEYKSRRDRKRRATAKAAKVANGVVA